VMAGRGGGRYGGGATRREELGNGVGWPTPARSRCSWAGGTPRHKTEAVGWLPGGPRPQFQAAAIKFNLKSNSNRFKTDSNHSNFDHLKNGVPELKKFELKYGFKISKG
jgi:hypothetical protein